MKRILMLTVVAALKTPLVAATLPLTPATSPLTDMLMAPAGSSASGTYSVTVPSGKRTYVTVSCDKETCYHAFLGQFRVLKNSEFVEELSSHSSVDVPFSSDGTLKLTTSSKLSQCSYYDMPIGGYRPDGRPYTKRMPIYYSDGYYRVDCTLTLSYRDVQTVTFDARGGTCTPSTREFAIGMPYELLPTPSRDQYAFAGWYTAASGGTEVTASSRASSSVTKLYARWTYDPTIYTITYRPGDYASGSERTGKKTHGLSTTLLGGVFSRSGYIQTGWSTHSDGQRQDYDLYQSYTANANLTLYPYWMRVYADIRLSTAAKGHDCFECNDSVDVFSESAWQINGAGSLPSWILRISPTSGSGNGTIRYELDRNYSDYPRKATVYVGAVSSMTYFDIVQEPYRIDVRWDFGGGTVGGLRERVDTCLASSRLDQIAPKPTRPGYELVGWGPYRSAYCRLDASETLKQVLGYFCKSEQTLCAHWRPADLSPEATCFEFDPQKEWDDNAAGSADRPFVIFGKFDASGCCEASFVATESGRIPFYLSATQPAEGFRLKVSVYDGYWVNEAKLVGSLTGNSSGKIELEKGKRYAIGFSADWGESLVRMKSPSCDFRLQIGGTSPLVNYMTPVEIAYSAVKDSTVRLSWPALTDITRYEVLRADRTKSEGAYGTERTVATINVVAGTEYVDFVDSTPLSSYVRYRVRPLAGALAGPLSPAVELLTDGYFIHCDHQCGNDFRVLECKCKRVYQLPTLTQAGRRFRGWTGPDDKFYDAGMMIFNLAQPGESVKMTAVWD